jgi:hypothetical protein
MRMSQMSDEGGRGERGGLASNRKFVVYSKTFVLLVTHREKKGRFMRLF